MPKYPHTDGRAYVAALAASVISALSIFSSPAAAQTGAGLALEPFPAELRLDGSADAWVMERGHAKGSDAKLGLAIVESDGRLRLNPGDVASPRVGYAFKYFDVDSSVPNLPDHLFDQSVGFATPLAKWDDWIVGLSVGLGYAGATPFGDGNAWYGRGTLMALKRFDEKTSLAVGIDYDGNRTFKPDVPLPGFAFIKRIDEKLLLTVGFPLTSIEWKPAEHWRFELGYQVVDNITARVGYEVAKGLEVYGSAGQRSDAFFLQDQRHGDDRLLFQQRRAEIGVAYRTKDAGVGDRDLELIVAGGYAWDGEFSVGFDQSDSDLVADVSDQPYVRFGLQLRF